MRYPRELTILSLEEYPYYKEFYKKKKGKKRKKGPFPIIPYKTSKILDDKL